MTGSAALAPAAFAPAPPAPAEDRPPDRDAYQPEARVAEAPDAESVQREAAEDAAFVPAIFTLDPEGRFARVGLRLARLLGVRRSELVGAPFTDYLDPIDDERFADRWYDLLAGAEALEMDATLVLRDGERRRARIDLLANDPDDGYSGVLTADIGHRGSPESEFEVARTLMDTFGIMVMVTDPNGVPLFSNVAVRARFGRPMGGGAAGFSLVHPDDRAAALAAWNEAITLGLPFTEEMRMAPVGGEHRWVRFDARPHYDNCGRIRFWAATLADVDEEMASRHALDEARRFIRRFGEASPDVMFLYDTEEGRNLYCSEAATEVLGYTPAEIAAMGPDLLPRIVHPDDFPWITEEMARAAADGGAPDANRTVEYRIVRKDGAVIWVSTRSLVFERHPDGRPKVNLGIAQDVTARKRIETEREDHTRILEHALSAVAVVDPHGRYVYANAEFAAVVGRPVSELVGRPWEDGVHPDDARRMEDEYQRMLDCGRIETECRGLRPDGTAIHQHVVMIPKYDGGAFAGHYRFVQDVTERLRFQHQLETQLAHISSMSAELEQRSDELERANAILAEQAASDGLTGLANHRVLQETLAELNDSGRPHALLLLDVDHFKAFNDEFGHPAGDLVLREFARVLDETTGGETAGGETTGGVTTAGGELAARYGGEEFALVLPDVDLQGAEARAETILARLAAIAWPRRAITASVGAAAWHPGRSRAELIEAADRALYVSKRNGRNRVTAAA